MKQVLIEEFFWEFSRIKRYKHCKEFQAMRHNPMYMSDYVEHLDNVLKATGEKVLQGAGNYYTMVL